MSKFIDYTKSLTEKFNNASTSQKVGIGAIVALGAVFHPAIIAGGAITAAVAAVGGTEAVSLWNKKNQGPQQ